MFIRSLTTLLFFCLLIILSSQEDEGQPFHTDPHPPGLLLVPAKFDLRRQSLCGKAEQRCGLWDNGSGDALLHVGHFQLVCCTRLPPLSAAVHRREYRNKALPSQSFCHHLEWVHPTITKPELSGADSGLTWLSSTNYRNYFSFYFPRTFMDSEYFH